MASVVQKDKAPQPAHATAGTDSQQNTQAGASVLGQFFWRLLWLPGLVRQLILARMTQKESKARLDHELRLYAEMFPGKFLHYGFFSDPQVKPEEISFADLDRAQAAYARKLIDLIEDDSSPVLDVGCGMGGLTFMLTSAGYRVVPLTPDRHQATNIRQQQPTMQVINRRFEDFDLSGYEQHFGTILTSESLQYLDLEASLPRIKQLLKPGGQWVACDYFRVNAGENSSGHPWDSFCEELRRHGLRIRYQEDITQHVLPTLKFGSMLANRFVRPVYNYIENKAVAKRPLLFYLLEAGFARARHKLGNGMRTIDPVHFAANKRYMCLVIEPVDNAGTG